MVRQTDTRVSIVAGIFSLTVAFFSFSLSANAQTLPFDPSVLEQLRGRSGGQAQQLNSPVDQARTGLESQVRADQQRQDFTVRPFSPIEIEYQNRANQSAARQSYLERAERERLARLFGEAPAAIDNSDDIVRRNDLLEQFGYDLFGSSGGVQDQVISGRIADSYVVGVGDEFVITLSGNEDRIIRTSVDSEGRLVVTDLPPIAAVGRTFGTIVDQLEREVSNAMIGTEVFVSLGSLRRISVYVLGEVERPGLYQATALSDVFDLLVRAGGVRKTGSLRQIQVQSGGEPTKFLDLYAVFRGQNLEALTLEDGARIVVPPLGPTIALEGDLVRPGIYELTAGQSLPVAEALALAGDPVRPRGNTFLLNRYDDTGQAVLKTLSDLQQAIEPGDLVQVMPNGLRGKGRVFLDGNVVRQGVYSFEDGMEIADLLADGQALKDGTYLPFAVLQTTSPDTLSQIFKPINLRSALDRQSVTELRDRDRLILLSQEDVSFLGGEGLRQVVVSPGKVRISCTALTFLRRRVEGADNERFGAVLRSYYVEDEVERQLQFLREEEQIRQQRISAASQIGNGRQQDLAALSREQERRQREEQAVEDKCPKIFNDYPEVLVLALEYGVSVLGSVREPGIYPVADEARLGDIVTLSGGLTRNANRNEAEVIRYSDNGDRTFSLRQALSLDRDDMEQQTIRPQSVLRFFSLRSDQEEGTVRVSGEFNRPGVYVIRRGETLAQLIERAGGLTKQAYPYGAVFTRVSVKRQQEDSFERTARELNSALALAALKGNADADAIVAAQQLAAAVTNAEAAGRVVIEADPDVLEADPTKDITLEPGDAVFMPKKPNFVLTAGDLLSPGALQYEPEKDARDYLDEAGGFQASADKSRVFIVYPNGVAQPLVLSSWSYNDMTLPPGSTIVVPKDTDPLATLEIVRDVAQIVGQLAISAASLAVVFDNR